MKKISWVFAAIILSFLFGVVSSESHVSAENEFNDLPRTGDVFTDMNIQLERFVTDGSIQDEDAAHALKLHLQAVEHYQGQNKQDKVMKHMKGFRDLLQFHHHNGAMSEVPFDVFNTYAQYMIGKQEGPFDSDKAVNHLKHLSVDIGPREAGSEGEREAAAYIESVLHRYGYETTIEEAPRSNRVETLLTVTSDNNKRIPVKAASGSGQTDAAGVTADLYNAGIGQPENFTGEAENKIAFIETGVITARAKVENAVAAGATGVIIYDNRDVYGLPTFNLSTYRPSIPVVGITKKDGELLLSQMGDKTVRVQVSTRTLTDQKTFNVIAAKKPKNVENPEIYYVGAHFDSVPYAPGASDNASGTSVLLELARTLKDYDGDKELRFAAFGGEELGYVGSRHHVNNLSPDEINRIKANLNMDMVGTGWVPASRLYVMTADGRPNIVSYATHAAADKLGINKDIVPFHMLGRSDHVPFHEKGIPATMYSWMEPGAPAGGSRVEPYYHSLEDKFEHISPERIQLTGDVAFGAISDLIGY